MKFNTFTKQIHLNSPEMVEIEIVLCVRFRFNHIWSNYCLFAHFNLMNDKSYQIDNNASTNQMC